MSFLTTQIIYKKKYMLYLNVCSVEHVFAAEFDLKATGASCS